MPHVEYCMQALMRYSHGEHVTQIATKVVPGPLHLSYEEHATKIATKVVPGPLHLSYEEHATKPSGSRTTTSQL